MINIANLYRIKLSIWFRQMYMPGMRGAVLVVLISLIVILTMRIITHRMAKLAAMQAATMSKPVRRHLAYVPVHK